VAVAECAKRFPGCDVKEMKHNDPGYDIRISQRERLVRYVEVKSTSKREADRYSLVVVANIDIWNDTHDEPRWHDGEVTVDGFGLKTARWRGKFPDE